MSENKISSKIIVRLIGCMIITTLLLAGVSCKKEGAEKKFKILNKFMYQEICIVNQRNIKGMVHFGKPENYKKTKRKSGYFLFLMAFVITFVVFAITKGFSTLFLCFVLLQLNFNSKKFIVTKPEIKIVIVVSIYDLGF